MQWLDVQHRDAYLGYGTGGPPKLQECSSLKRLAPSPHWCSLGMLEQQAAEAGRCRADCSHPNLSNLPQCSLPRSELVSLGGESGAREEPALETSRPKRFDTNFRQTHHQHIHHLVCISSTRREEINKIST